LLKRTIILAAFVGCLTAIAQTPERKVVNNNIIISDHDPKVRIELPKSVWYVGVDRFVLLDIADCELYAFVEIDDQKNVQRLYWIQFENYLPSKPDLHHHYDSPRHMTIGGFRFYVDTWVKRTNENITAGSDEDHIAALILSRGYKDPTSLVRDPDKTESSLLNFESASGRPSSGVAGGVVCPRAPPHCQCGQRAGAELRGGCGLIDDGR
jgi:hypothetical protein